MKLNELRPAKGSRQTPRRVGRGHGSGRGKTAGRGTKGQKARGKLPAWFEGGQTPLHIRTPKLHGFKNRFRVEYAPVNLTALSGSEKGTLITPAVMAHAGLVRDERHPVKILGVGDAPAGITIHAHGFSKSALEKLAAAGSNVQRLSWPDNDPVDLVETPPERPADGRGKKARRRRAAEVSADDGEDTSVAEEGARGARGAGDDAAEGGDRAARGSGDTEDGRSDEGERAEPEPEG